VKEFKEDQIDGIPQNKFDKLKSFLDHPLFEKDKVFNASSAAGNLSMWIRAVVDVR
jgi:dynein heavy chain, axonemal